MSFSCPKCKRIFKRKCDLTKHSKNIKPCDLPEGKTIDEVIEEKAAIKAKQLLDRPDNVEDAPTAKQVDLPVKLIAGDVYYNLAQVAGCTIVNDDNLDLENVPTGKRIAYTVMVKPRTKKENEARVSFEDIEPKVASNPKPRAKGKTKDKKDTIIQSDIRCDNPKIQNHIKIYEEIHNMMWSMAGLSAEKALSHLIFLLMFNATEHQLSKMGLDDKCKWSKLFEDPNESAIMKKFKMAYDSFKKSKLTSSYVNKWEIEKDALCCKILRRFNDLKLTELNDRDALGDLVEYIIGRGASSISTNGEYYTPKKACHLAFKLCYQIRGKLRDDEGELLNFGDFFCGTGGFVRAFIRGVQENDKLVDWTKDKNHIYALDIMLQSIHSTLLNLLMMTGETFPSNHITNCNSFQDDILVGKKAKFKGVKLDYALFNPPYDGNGFVYVEQVGKKNVYHVNSDIQTINIPENTKASAGAQLAMSSLNDEGVCSIVLPNGFFFGSAKSQIELRKKLIEEYNVKYVVDIGSEFANTTTATCMIVFQKSEEKTSVVKFITLDEQPICEATVEQIRKKNYNLMPNKYKSIDVQLKENFEVVRLGDIIEYVKNGKTKSSEYNNKGIYPFYSCRSDNPWSFSNSYDYDDTEYLLFAKSGGNSKKKTGFDLGIGKIYYRNGRSAFTSDVLVFINTKKEKYNLKYVTFLLESKLFDIQLLANYTTGLGHIKTPDFLDMEVLIPSYQEQLTIAEQLTPLDDMIKTCKRDIIHLRNVCTFNILRMYSKYDTKPLSDVLQIVKHTKKYKVSDGKDEGLYPLLRSSKDHKVKYLDTYSYEGPYIAVGTGGSFNIQVRTKFNASGDYRLYDVSDGNNMWYIYMLIESYKQHIEERCFQKTTIAHMTHDNFAEIELPLPPIEIQNELNDLFIDIKNAQDRIVRYQKRYDELIRTHFNDEYRKSFINRTE